MGRRTVLLGCWGAFQDPYVCDYKYRTMNEWGNSMYATPGVIVDGELVTTNLVDINLGIRILLGSSYYEDWQDTGGGPLARLWATALAGKVDGFFDSLQKYARHA